MDQAFTTSCCLCEILRPTPTHEDKTHKEEVDLTSLFSLSFFKIPLQTFLQCCISTWRPSHLHSQLRRHLFFFLLHTLSVSFSFSSQYQFTHTHTHKKLATLTASHSQCRSDTQGAPSGRFPYIHLERIDKALHVPVGAFSQGEERWSAKRKQSCGSESLRCTEAWELTAALLW